MTNLIQFGAWIDDTSGDPNEARPATKEQVIEAIAKWPEFHGVETEDDGVFLIESDDAVWNKLEESGSLEYVAELSNGERIRLSAETA